MLSFLALFAAVGAVYGSQVSPAPLTHAEAVAYCAAQGSRLANVNQANLAALTAAAGHTPKWVGSWNGDNYNNACLILTQGTIVTADCNRKYHAICHAAPQPCPPEPSCESVPVPPCPPSEPSCHSIPVPPPAPSCSSESVIPCPEPEPLPSCESSSSSSSCSVGPRRRHHRRSSSLCSSSSSSGCEVPFQYVYLTSTVTTSFTSLLTVTTTTTAVETEIIGTVAAYTVTAEA